MEMSNQWLLGAVGHMSHYIAHQSSQQLQVTLLDLGQMILSQQPELDGLYQKLKVLHKA
jgi:hypothetical protein